MKLKTTLILAACGILTSAAGAFAIPMSKTAKVDATPEPNEKGEVTDPSHMVVGDTLLVDARLGHATLAKGASSGETFLFAQVTADEKGATATPPMNLALVIDRSGSMKGERIVNAMNAAVGAVERMRDGDSVTVVAFDQGSQVVVAPQKLSPETRPRIENAIRAIRLGGDTCISCGLQEAMRQLQSTPISGDHIDKMVLLSDGATNSGIKDMPGIRAMASRMHGKGVTISTVGVDVDFDEKVMATIASEAQGNHHFAANASALPGIFAREFDESLASVAKEAELSIDLAPGVEVAEVFDRTFRREGNKLIVPFGTFSAQQEKTVPVKLRVPTEKEGAENVAAVKLAYRDLVKKSDGSCSGNLGLAIKGDGSEQKDLDPFVSTRLERSRTAQTLTEANKLFEAGRVDEAKAALATRRDTLAKNETQIVGAANSGFARPPTRAAKGVKSDFDDQLNAVAQAETNFAQPPPVSPGRSGGAANSAPLARPAPAQESHEGKAQVRQNQEDASKFRL